MAVNERGTCANCLNRRRKPSPLGPVMGLPPETADVLVCRPCSKLIHDQARAFAETRLRLQMTLEFAALLSAGSCPA